MITEMMLSRLTPSKLNPRQHFDPVALSELTENIRLHGVLSNLIVRPLWCVGQVTEAEIKLAAKNDPRVDDPPSLGHYEIVSGERRYRAAVALQQSDSYLVPVRVKEMTDPDVLAINLSEQMQRNELTPLEEAEAFARMLAFKDEKGKALHTAATLAASVGKAHDYVLLRLKLRELPASLKQALKAGTVAPRVVERIARIPDKVLREEAAGRVLKGGRDGGVMTSDEVRAMISEDFVVVLAGAPFDQADPDLVATAGICSACPHRSGNMPDETPAKKGKRTDVCTNPACYRAKCAAAFKQVADVAVKMGVKVLDEKESAKLFETHRPTEVRFNCDWVELDTRPMAHLLKDEVKNPPVWRELLEAATKAGMKPEVVLAKDGSGRGRWLVDSSLLITASEKIGEPIFRGQGSDAAPVEPREGEDADDTFSRGKREHAEKLKRGAIAAAEDNRKRQMVQTATVKAVATALADGWTVAPIWEVMLDLLLSAGNVPAWHLLADLLDEKRERTGKQLLKKLDLRSPRQKQAMAPLLLGATDIMRDGAAAWCLRKLAVHAGVDLKKVERDALALKSEPPKPKPKEKAAKSTKAKATSKKRGAK
jgi:ParB/RepB/Spo0J family partition protein